MKYKKYVFASVLILVQSVLCRDLLVNNDARFHRRNSRRIDRSHSLDKSVDELLVVDGANRKEKSPTVIIKENKERGESTIRNDHVVRDEAPIKDLEKKELSLFSEASLQPESGQKDESEFLENPNRKRVSNKRKRLIEVRKTKINTNEDNSEKNDSEPDKNTYFTSRNEQLTAPDWAIPKKRQKSKPEFRILDMKNYVYSDRGEFHYSYESADGTKAYERGQLRKLDNNSEGTAVFGGFSYKGNDGENYNLKYTADENGYRPVGDHLPTPPPIPPAIARALFYLATKSPPLVPSAEDPIKYDYDYY